MFGKVRARPRRNMQLLQWEAALGDCDVKIAANVSPEIVQAARERKALIEAQMKAHGEARQS